MILRIIRIPEYIRRIKLSESRRARYYEKGKSVPPYVNKKIAEKVYKYKAFKVGGKRKYFLVDGDGNRVVANPRVAGTPRYKVINGQQFYKGALHSAERRKIIEAIKEDIRQHLDRVVPIDKDHYPVQIKVEVYDQILDPEIKDQLWDLDNRFYPYQKAFQDILVEEGIIPEDNIMYITSPPSPQFIPVDRASERALVFKIYKDNRKIVTDNEQYQEYFGRSSGASDTEQ